MKRTAIALLLCAIFAPAFASKELLDSNIG